MARYNREERRRDRRDPEPQDAGDFPWQSPPDGASGPQQQSGDQGSVTGPPPAPDSGHSPPPDPSAGRGTSEDFPWQSAGDGTPRQDWDTGAPDPDLRDGAASAPAAPQTQTNGLAIAGFVCSLLMWIPVPYTAPIFWLMALTFSSIGLSRSRRRGAPHKGLAIAGLCISLIGVVFVILLILFFVGFAALGN